MARLAAIRKQREATKVAKEKEANGASGFSLVSWILYGVTDTSLLHRR